MARGRGESLLLSFASGHTRSCARVRGSITAILSTRNLNRRRASRKTLDATADPCTIVLIQYADPRFPQRRRPDLPPDRQPGHVPDLLRPARGGRGIAADPHSRGTVADQPEHRRAGVPRARTSRGGRETADDGDVRLRRRVAAGATRATEDPRPPHRR